MSSQQQRSFAMNHLKINVFRDLFKASRKRRAFDRSAQLLVGDERGQSGIEFALLLPLMALLVAGAMDLGLGLMIKRKVNQIASSTSDIIPQEDAWPSSGVKAVLQGGASTLNPFDTGSLKIVVSVLDFDTHGNATVNWSKGFQDEGLVGGSPWTDPIPEKVVEPGVQLVVTRVEYNARSALTGLLATLTGIETYNFTGFAIARPRVGDKVKMN